MSEEHGAGDLSQFSPTELHAMWRAGEIARHGIRGFEFYLPLGYPATLLDRARSLASVQCPGRVFSRLTAHWLYLGGTPPERVEVSRRSWRIAPPGSALQFRHARYEPHQIQQLAGLTVTRPVTTMYELAAAGDIPRVLSLLSALCAVHPIQLDTERLRDQREVKVAQMSQSTGKFHRQGSVS